MSKSKTLTFDTLKVAKITGVEIIVNTFEQIGVGRWFRSVTVASDHHTLRSVDASVRNRRVARTVLVLCGLCTFVVYRLRPNAGFSALVPLSKA